MKRTFSIGGVHPHDNKLSSGAAIENFPLPERVSILMTQHLGAPASPIVEKGDKVKVGQVIAKPVGFISGYIHSSVSGTVSSVEPVKDFAGRSVMSVNIDVEGDEWVEEIDKSDTIIKEISLDPEEILKRISECGVVGLGGAAFPAHIKLSPPPGTKAEFLLINGAECEPYITADHRVMLEHTEELLIGVKIMMKALGVEKAIVGIEENKKDAITAINNKLGEYPGISVMELKKMYPQGGEKQLIDAILKRRVPALGLPIDVGVVVQNVSTAFAVYQAVQKNKPLFERVLTLTGGVLGKRHNFRVRMGTSLDKLLALYPELGLEGRKIIHGGPMMGKAVSVTEAPLMKSSSSILILDGSETKRGVRSNCIRCGKCVDACPMGLEPYLLFRLAGAKRYDDLEEIMVYDCMECGCCMYTCPANIPLLDAITIAKSDVIKIMRSRRK